MKISADYKRKPIINAILAESYIIILVFVLQYIFDPINTKTLFVPIVMLSLFVLSVLVMGHLFLFEPLMLYLDGKKKKAVNLFLRTLTYFAGITAIMLVAYFVTVLF